MILKRKLFATAWDSANANTYEQCFRNPDKDENKQLMKGLERKYPEETARLKKKLRNPNYTTNRGAYAGPEQTKIEDTIEDKFAEIDREYRKGRQKIAKRRKLAKIGGIGAAVAATAGLGYGLKNQYNKKKEWEKKKEKILPTDANGKVLSDEKLEHYRGKETDDQKRSRQYDQGQIVGTGSSLSALGAMHYLKSVDDRIQDLSKRRNDLLDKKGNFAADFINKSSLGDAEKRSAGENIGNRLSESVSKSNSAIERYKRSGRLDKSIRKARTRAALGVAGGILASSALATMYGMKKKRENEESNSRSRLRKLNSKNKQNNE